MLRTLRLRRARFVLTAALALPGSAAAQLRPLDPLDWRLVGREGRQVAMGGGMYSGQRASLAGTTGRLVEVGTIQATWGLGRVALDFAGTALWLFDARSTFADPAFEVVPAKGSRHDVGDFRVSTIVRLSEPDPRRALALRFGVRLPTTDNMQGLDRDETDFFALLAGRTAGRGVELGAELGLGVYGTRDAHNEQVDPLLFGLSARWDLGPGQAVVELAGQHDPRAGPDQRGNEDLGEARVGMRVGKDRWLAVALVRGWTPYSPDLGATVKLGTRF